MRLLGSKVHIKGCFKQQGIYSVSFSFLSYSRLDSKINFNLCSCNDSYPVDCLREVDFEVLNGLFNPNCDHPKPWESQYKFATGIVQDGYWYNDTIWSTLQSFSSPIPIVGDAHHLMLAIS
jgi:hypothetical protein